LIDGPFEEHPEGLGSPVKGFFLELRAKSFHFNPKMGCKDRWGEESGREQVFPI
jgi:hypothetical protein